MAQPLEIPMPVSSGAIDQPSAPQSGVPSGPPPVPAGFSDAPPVPAGFSDTSPSSGQENPLQSVMDEGKPTGAEQFVSNAGENFLKSAEGTLAGAGNIGNKLTGGLLEKAGNKIGDVLGLPKENSNSPHVDPYKATGQEADKGVGGTAEKIIGYGGENLVEFMLGDEALKGMSLAEKMKNISGAVAIFEKSPVLMKAVQTGTNIIKAVGELGVADKEAIQKSPILARLVSLGMDAAREGTVAGAQETAKTGDVKKGAETGAIQAVTSGVLGGAFKALGRAGEKAGEAGKAVQEASSQAAAAPSKVEAGEKVASKIQDAEQTMHSDFETGIQNLKGKLGDAKIPYKGSPLQQSAADAMEGRADVPSKKTTALGNEFKDLAGGSEQTKKLLFGLTDPGKEGDLTIDELIQRRQQLGEKIGQMTKGATSSADRADVQVYQKLRDGIDQTIDSLAKNSGSPEASQDYKALRDAYKTKVGLFKEPVIRALSDPGVDKATSLDNAAKYLLSGGKVLDKVGTLEQVIGSDGLKDFGKHIVQNVMADAAPEGGQVNPIKFAKEWKKIEALPPEVKTKLFDMSGAADGLDKLSKDLKSAANYHRLVRAGILSAAGGGLTHGWGAILGLLGEANLGKATELLDKVANSPKMWSAFRTAGSTAEKVAASPTARRAATAVKYGTGSALNNVLQGANDSLSSPIQEDEGVYTNQ
jgi:hypothetical protein